MIPVDGFSEIVNKDVSWVKNCQDNRIYLNPEYLIVSKNRMVVVDEYENETFLTELYSDANGIYTKAESFGKELPTVWNIVWCNTCQAYRTTSIKGVCVVCGNAP